MPKCLSALSERCSSGEQSPGALDNARIPCSSEQRLDGARRVNRDLIEELPKRRSARYIP